MSGTTARAGGRDPRRPVRLIPLYALLIALTLLFVAPILWVFSTSLKPNYLTTPLSAAVDPAATHLRGLRHAHDHRHRDAGPPLVLQQCDRRLGARAARGRHLGDGGLRPRPDAIPRTKS